MHIEYGRSTKLLGLLGYPLGHSIVPALHNGLYHFGGINAVLLPMELENVPGNLDRFFEAVRTLNIQGFIVTMPYKTQILPYLDEAAEVCHVFNSVNAVRYKDGKFYGAVFDGYGMCQAIEDAGCSLAGREALILGAGGIGGPVAGEMSKRGVTGFTILNRTPEKAEQLGKVIRTHMGLPVHTGPLCERELNQAAKRAGVVAQCTSAGMSGTGTVFPCLEFIQKLAADTVVVDALYHPPQTALLAAAAQRGLQTVNGMGMLSNQVDCLLQFLLDKDLGPEGRKEAVRLIQLAMSHQ